MATNSMIKEILPRYSIYDSCPAYVVKCGDLFINVCIFVSFKRGKFLFRLWETVLSQLDRWHDNAYRKERMAVNGNN